MNQSKLTFSIPRLLLMGLSVYVLIDSFSVIVDYFKGETNHRIYDGFGDAIMSFMYAVVTVVCLMIIFFQKHILDLVAGITLLVSFLLSMVIVGESRFFILAIVTLSYSIYSLRRIGNYWVKLNKSTESHESQGSTKKDFLTQEKQE